MLQGKVCVVTGGASGIGRAMVESFAKEGARVVAADINQKLLEDVSAQTGCTYVEGDLSKRSACKELIDVTLDRHGQVDILINVAGIQTVSPVDAFPEDKWDFMISLMLTAPFLLTRYAWPSMKENGWGRIINIGSIHSLVASEFKVAYVSAKHGLMGLTRTAALEGGPLGITVNAICPAYVRTPLVDKQIADQAAHHGVSEDEVVGSIMLQKAAIKKLLEPETVADMAKFLCSPAADSITGAALTVDGGWTAA